ncbi:aspartate--tRNA ligase [Acholeplasma granularum]|uniref:aspartate--tRNA ligase n=1 Tax=Acholeplasma granularum TaxID=264635 RepID=UPI0004B2908B|nr:aspartate--tRNA ligase [Acholeplasma granularum]
MNKYTHHNNELTLKNLNQEVSLKGWVSKKRNLGGLIFIDLRDMHGITQLLCRPESPIYEEVSQLKNEYVIEVKGVVLERESKNNQILTGDIEVLISDLNVLNTAVNPPITISDQDNISEEVRLKYRYLDLRKPSSKSYLIKRSLITQQVRQTLLKNDFLELETPYLVKTTPEGAKEFIVPSRLYHGEGYALAQSPQIFKQLYMISGFEKYFQIARCFRDEDLRADRQLEFTQIDIEASFSKEEDIFNLSEEIMQAIFKNVLNKELKLPIEKMTYENAFNLYGSDKPDLRFELKLMDYTSKIKRFNIPLFENKEMVRALIVPNNPIFTRKYFDKLTEIVKKNHGDALAYVKNENNNLQGSIAKFVDTSLVEENHILFLIPGTYFNATNATGALRKQLGQDLNMIDENLESLVWIVDFPLFEYDENDQRLYARHHPFTAPKNASEFTTNPKDMIARAYDLVWNGYEVGGGSMRIYDQTIQNQMFETLGFTKEEIENKFGFFIDALKYGTPPHGGIAFGLDRIVMLATKTDNIKDVIAFPKTQSAKDLMMGSPSMIVEEQLEELGLKVVK